MRIVVAVSLICIAVGAAWAEGTPEDWQKLAQPIVDKFGACTRGEVDRTWNSTAAASEIAAAAVETCVGSLDPLPAVLADKPFSTGDAEIAETLELLKKEMRDAALADIEKRRKD